jgi:hypothetical protein
MVRKVAGHGERAAMHRMMLNTEPMMPVMIHKEPAMPTTALPTTATMQHQAHLLGETLRAVRAAAAHTLPANPHAVQAMEAELAVLWTAIRLARASATAATADRSVHRSQGKWH